MGLSLSEETDLVAFSCAFTLSGRSESPISPTGTIGRHRRLSLSGVHAQGSEGAGVVFDLRGDLPGKGENGAMEIEVPRDRVDSFEPQLIRKTQRSQRKGEQGIPLLCAFAKNKFLHAIDANEVALGIGRKTAYALFP